jgi:hypothetical protein
VPPPDPSTVCAVENTRPPPAEPPRRLGGMNVGPHHEVGRFESGFRDGTGEKQPRNRRGFRRSGRQRDEQPHREYPLAEPWSRGVHIGHAPKATPMPAGNRPRDVDRGNRTQPLSRKPFVGQATCREKTGVDRNGTRRCLRWKQLLPRIRAGPCQASPGERTRIDPLPGSRSSGDRPAGSSRRKSPLRGAGEGISLARPGHVK